MGPRPGQQRRAPTALPPSGPELARSTLRSGEVLGRWRIAERVGAKVFAGVDEATGEAVVVKVAGADELRREVAALRAVQHPHLVRLAGRGDGGLATSRVPGTDLATVLERRPLSWPVAAGLLAPVADALAALHGAGWVHGDVSPANVVVGGRGAVLVDLGHARPREVAGPPSGTPGSVAPEVASGQAGGPAADVWSLAAVVVEAVTGAPFDASTVLPPGPALALRRALAVDPAARPSAAELAAALRAGAGAGSPSPSWFSSVSVSESETPTLEFAGERARITREYGPRPPAPAALAVRRRRLRPTLRPWF